MLTLTFSGPFCLMKLLISSNLGVIEPRSVIIQIQRTNLKLRIITDQQNLARCPGFQLYYNFFFSTIPVSDTNLLFLIL